MEKDKREEFSKKMKERQEKLNKAVDLSSLKYLQNSLLYMKHMDKVLENPCHLQFEIHPGSGSSLAFNGSNAQLVFAVANILSQEEKADFYENLSSVVAVAMLLQDGFRTEKLSIRPETVEELRVYEELIKKSPEEFEKIKSQIEK